MKSSKTVKQSTLAFTVFCKSCSALLRQNASCCCTDGQALAPRYVRCPLHSFSWPLHEPTLCLELLTSPQPFLPIHTREIWNVIFRIIDVSRLAPLIVGFRLPGLLWENPYYYILRPGYFRVIPIFQPYPCRASLVRGFCDWG